MHLDINPSTRWWEAQITAYRFQLENERVERRKLMAIEIKGLRSDALLARANIDRVRAAYARFNQAAPAHADDVDKLASDITGMQSDLEFAATVMGNSADASEKLPAGSVVRPKALPEGTAATTEGFDRVALGPHPDQPEAMQAALLHHAEKMIDGAPPVIQEVADGASQTFRAAE